MTQQTNTSSVGSNNNRNPHVGRGREGFSGQGDRGNNTSIPKSSFEGKLGEGFLHKLTITEGSYQAKQLKKIHDALLVLCANKGYKHLDNIIGNNQELVRVTHMPAYLDATTGLITMDVKIDTIDSTALSDASIGAHPVIKLINTKTHVFDDILQKKESWSTNFRSAGSNKNEVK